MEEIAGLDRTGLPRKPYVWSGKKTLYAFVLFVGLQPGPCTVSRQASSVPATVSVVPAFSREDLHCLVIARDGRRELIRVSVWLSSAILDGDCPLCWGLYRHLPWRAGSNGTLKRQDLPCRFRPRNTCLAANQGKHFTKTGLLTKRDLALFRRTDDFRPNVTRG